MSDVLPITLYIPCYNAAPFLERVLPAARAQRYPVQEILVVDDGSSDATAEIARRHGVRVVQHETNRGLGATRNTAIRAAGTDYVAALDADVVAQPDWLELLAADLADGEFVGACGNLIETVDRTLADRWRHVHMQQGWGEQRLEDPEFLYGNNGLYLKQALLGAGLYDETCRTNGEDVTMTANLKRIGARLVYDPRARCLHLRADTVRSICRGYWKYHFYGQKRVDWAYLKFTRDRARYMLLRRFRREDLAARRWRLALLDTWMYWEWRLFDWSRFLGLRP